MSYFKIPLLGSVVLGSVLMASPSGAQTKTLSGLATGWTQVAPYNSGCPKSTAGVRARVGSAGLAVAQVLRFNGAKYDFPPTGLKSHSYTDKTPDVTGTFAANYATTSYPWSKLPASITAADANVSTLLYHAGVALDTDYGTKGSYLPKFSPTAGTTKPADAVKVAQTAVATYFGYTGGTILSNTATNGVLPQASLDKIKAEINAGYPVIAALSGTSGGQFTIISGYSGNKFNFLFGLGGGDGAYEFGKIAVPYKDGTQSLTGTFNGPSAFLLGVRPPAPPSLSLGDASVVEGNSGTTTLKFPVTLSKATSWPITATIKTAKGTATPGTDYTEKSGTVTIAAGKTTGTFEVAVKGDLSVESNETILASLTAGKLPVARAKATGTITDDDTTASVADVSIVEGNTGETKGAVKLTLAKAVAYDTKFSYTLAAGTATSGTDYKNTTGQVTVPAKSTTVSIPISILGDYKQEDNETFTVKVTSLSGPVLSKGTATVTITDDDTTASVADVSVAEGNTGETAGAVKLTLAKALTYETKFSYELIAGTATADTDYKKATGQVTVPAKSTEVSIPVVILGDYAKEANETLSVKVTSAQGIALTKDTATVTITDDDTSVGLADTTIVEGNTGETAGAVTLTLANAVAYDTKFSYTLQAGTATADTDYKNASGEVTVPANSTVVSIPVTVLGDYKKEADETFTVKVTSAQGVALTRDTATVTIKDDDPVLSVSSPVVVETDFGLPKADFTLTLDRASTSSITVSYATQNGTASAIDDYIGTTGTLTFAPGELTKVVSVSVSGDKREESDETFGLTITSTQVDVIAQGTATIRDDDASIVVTSSVQTTEGQAVPAISVALSRALTIPVEITYSTADSSAKAGSDYTAATGTLTFAPGDGAKTISLQTIDDSTGEGTETFVVNFYSQVLEESAQTVVNILDNDAALTINPTSEVEGNTQARSLNFSVRLSNAYSQRVTVAYMTVDGTAKAGVDYVAGNGAVVFEPGETSKTITVTTIPDTTVESDETFGVKLSSTTIPVPTDAAIGTILDDDYTLSVANVSVIEGNSNPVNATFTVKLSKPLSFDLSVNFSTSEGSAKYTTDFDQKSTTLTFAAGETEKTVNVVVFGDTVDEDDETFGVTVTSSYYYYDDYHTTTATGTIVDDDDPKTPLTGRIVFSARNGSYYDIYTSNTNGSNLTRLTFTDDRSEQRPILSPDGSKIVYYEGSTLYVIDADGRNIRSLYSYARDYRFSPDGTKLVFSDGSNIYTINIDGSGLTQLTTSGSNSKPQFSPNGTRILYESSASGQTELYTMTATGRSQTRLTRIGGTNGRWSPDSTKVVFEATDGDQEIYVINADGTAQTKLTDNSTDDIRPRWNADGTVIIFLSNRTNTYGIYTMTVAGAQQTLLTQDGNIQTEQEIVLSPNGGFIAYASYDNSRYVIRILELVTGSQPRTLPTTSFSVAQEPNWGANLVPTPPTTTLPIGELTGKIVFDGQGGIKIRNAAGTNVSTVKSSGYIPIFTPDGSSVFYQNSGLFITDVLGNVTDAVDASATTSNYVANSVKTLAYYDDSTSRTIKVGNLTTGNITELLPKPESPYGYTTSNAVPILSANEANVIFQSYHAVYNVENESYDYRTDIASIPVGGGTVTYLTNSDDNYLYAVNPVSSKIAFDHYYYDNNANRYVHDVTLMNADGSNRQVVLSLTNRITDMQFSPDGSKIAVASNGVVYEGTADGSALANIFSSGYANTLRFEPNSAHIGISCDNGFWVVKPDGSDPIRLTYVSYFDWKAGSAPTANSTFKASPSGASAKASPAPKAAEPKTIPFSPSGGNS